jgi:PPOX class probable F420-dependent enzyme
VNEKEMPASVIPETHLDLLEKPFLAHCATIGPNGEPQVNPVWFLWNGSQIVLSIDPVGQKAKNLARDPRISVSIVDHDNPIHYLEIRGTATFDRQVDSQDPTVIAMVRKYTGNDTYPGMPEHHSLYLVEPLRTTRMD